MSPQLHDPKCAGRLNSVELDGGEATLLSCSSCDYYSYSENSLIEYPKKTDINDEDTIGGYKTCKDTNIDDLTYVGYPDIETISLDPFPIFDDIKYVTDEKPIHVVSQHLKSSCPAVQRNQSTPPTVSSDVSLKRAYSSNTSQCTATNDLQRKINRSKSSVDSADKKTATSFSCAEIDECLELIPCPKCQSPNTQIVDKLNIRYCRDCGSCFGADDSMDLEDLQNLFDAQKIVFKSKSMCKCGNSDVERFVLSEVDELTGRVMVDCLECTRRMALDGLHEEHVEEDADDDGWVLADSNDEDTSLDSGVGLESVSLESTIDRGQESFRCSFCNHAEDGFFEKQRDIHGRVTSAKCLNCDKDASPAMLCPICRNDKDFETLYGSDGSLIFAACRNCLNALDLPRNTSAGDDKILTSPEEGYRWGKKRPVRRRIYSVEDLRFGDHVTLHKEYVLWHHAIVVSHRPHHRKVTVVHYTGGLKKHQGHFTSVREEEIELNFDKDMIYVCDYGMACYPPEQVVSRARSRLGEHRYNLLSKNCEHFAHWCKTGREFSGQVKSVCRRLWRTLGSAAGAGVREGVVTACRGLIEGISAKEVFRVGLNGRVGRVQGVTGGPALAAGLKGGAVVFDVFLNLALEVGLFAYCAHKSHQKCKSGEITKGQFYRELCQTGCECAGGFLGATAGGFLGQLAIPVPFLGTVVGCTLGSIIGRFIGSVVGKKIADRFIDPM